MRSLFCSAISLVAILLLLSCSDDDVGSTGSDQDESVVENFTLQSASGEVSLASYRGGVVLIFFGYTHCPDICPATMNNVAQALNRLTQAERDRTHAFFITVDPARDSAEHLAEYLSYFHPNIVGLTGDEASIRKVAKIFMVEFFREDGGEAGDSYQMLHSSRLFLVDSQGKLADMMSYHTAPDDIVISIRHHL